MNRTRDLMKPLFESFARDLAEGRFKPSLPYEYHEL